MINIFVLIMGKMKNCMLNVSFTMVEANKNYHSTLPLSSTELYGFL